MFGSKYYQVISSVLLIFTAINQLNFKGDIIDFIKLLKICKLINDKTGKKIINILSDK